MRLNHRSLFACAALCALILVLAACGGGGGGTSTTPTPTPTPNPSNPAPTVTAVSPSPITNVHAGTTLTVTGTGYITSSAITFNGTARTTTFVSSTQLQMTLSTADVATAGSVQIGVTNPAPGGGSSAPLSVPVQSAAPIATSMAPNAATVGGTGFNVTVSGAGFVAASVVRWNGSDRTTTFVNASQLKAQITAADISSVGTATITVFTPAPGGGTSSGLTFTISAFPVPQIAFINPVSAQVGSGDTTIDVEGGSFVTGSVVQVNGTDLATVFFNPFQLSAVIPAANLASTGQLSITVSSPPPGGGVSNAVNFAVLPNPVPVANGLSPSGAAAGSASQTVTVFGNSFTSSSVVRWNGTDRATQFVNPFTLTITLANTDLQAFGNNSVVVFTPGPGGGTSQTLNFTVFLGLATNDLVYNRFDGLLYASVPSSGGPTLGNSIVTIDPFTGNLGTPILVGSEPKKLALSDDGTTMWVVLDGASSVRKVDLTTKTATATQIYFPGDPHVGLSPISDLAVLPGSPNSVAVALGGIIRIFDGTVQRPNTSTSFFGASAITFGTSPNTLYALDNGFTIYTLDATGITGSTNTPLTTFSNGLRFDAGRVYLTSGAIIDATTGSLLATLAATGPVAPDSGVQRAFVLAGTNFSFSPDHIAAFRTDTFVPAGSVPIGGVSTNNFPGPSSLIRWGQDGLAFRTGDSQVFLLRTTLVRDLSTTIADLAVTGSGPSTGTTGTNLTYTATVTNHGPNPATNVSLLDNLPSGSIFVSATPSQGSCGGTTVVRCNFGTIANGASATLQVVITPTTAGTATNIATVAAVEGDNNTANNSASTSTAVTGADFHAVPQVISFSPNAVQSGSAGFTLTVSGSGFGPSSTVRWNGADLPTTFVNGASLTATVDAALIQKLGWAMVDVATPAPGGGTSAGRSLTIYSVLSLDNNGLLFDPFTGKLWTSVPSTAPQVTGNSLLPIDPAAASLGTPVNIGSEPTHISLSDDGQFIYTVLAGSNEVIRMDVPTLTPGARFTTIDNLFKTPFAAADVAVMPGNHDSVATSSFQNALQVWDVSGNTAVKRGEGGFVFSGVFLGWTDNTHLYSYDSGLSPSKIHRFSVTANSVTELDETNVTGFGGHFTPSGGLLYSDQGGVVDPLPNPPQLLGRFAGSGPSTIDTATRRSFFLNNASFFSSNLGVRGIAVFDQNTFNILDSADLSLLLNNNNNFANPSDLVRWGADGLAFRIMATGPFQTAGSGKVVLLRGPLVTPQVAFANAVPTATSVAPSTVSSGATNTYFNVTGSGFVPGAVAFWNGVERSTTFVNSTTVKVAIPASDLKAAGTGAITVVNPNSAASAAVSVTIN